MRETNNKQESERQMTTATATETTMVAKNRFQSVEIIREHCGVHVKGGTAVYPTVSGEFAVVNFRDGFRLIKVFQDKLQARHYNFAINDDFLGE